MERNAPAQARGQASPQLVFLGRHAPEPAATALRGGLGRAAGWARRAAKGAEPAAEEPRQTAEEPRRAALAAPERRGPPIAPDALPSVEESGWRGPSSGPRPWRPAAAGSARDAEAREADRTQSPLPRAPLRQAISRTQQVWLQAQAGQQGGQAALKGREGPQQHEPPARARLGARLCRLRSAPLRPNAAGVPGQHPRRSNWSASSSRRHRVRAADPGSVRALLPVLSQAR